MEIRLYYGDDYMRGVVTNQTHPDANLPLRALVCSYCKPQPYFGPPNPICWIHMGSAFFYLAYENDPLSEQLLSHTKQLQCVKCHRPILRTPEAHNNNPRTEPEEPTSS
jgi:hypothetical protein